MQKIWDNQFLSIFTNVNANKLDTSKLNIRLKSNPVITLQFSNDGYDTVSSDNPSTFKVNELNLANKILLELFTSYEGREGRYGESIPMDEGVAGYLISASKTKDEYLYDDGHLFNISYNTAAVRDRLLRYVDKLTSDDAIVANNVFIEIIDEMPLSEQSRLVNNDLHYTTDHSNSVKKNEKDCYGEAYPVFSCGYRKVSPLIRHIINKINKEKLEGVLGVPKANLQLISIYKRLKKIVDFGDVTISAEPEYVEVFTCIPYRITIMSNSRACLSWKEKNGEIHFIKNIKPEADTIVNYIMTNEDSGDRLDENDPNVVSCD